LENAQHSNTSGTGNLETKDGIHQLERQRHHISEAIQKIQSPEGRANLAKQLPGIDEQIRALQSKLACPATLKVKKQIEELDFQIWWEEGGLNDNVTATILQYTFYREEIPDIPEGRLCQIASKTRNGFASQFPDSFTIIDNRRETHFASSEVDRFDIAGVYRKVSQKQHDTWKESCKSRRKEFDHMCVPFPRYGNAVIKEIRHLTEEAKTKVMQIPYYYKEDDVNPHSDKPNYLMYFKLYDEGTWGNGGFHSGDNWDRLKDHGAWYVGKVCYYTDRPFAQQTSVRDALGANVELSFGGMRSMKYQVLKIGTPPLERRGEDMYELVYN